MGIELVRCVCKKDWGNGPAATSDGTLKGIHFLYEERNEADAQVWTGYLWQPNQLNWWRGKWKDKTGTPQYVMDLTYYAMGETSMNEETFEALYKKGRSLTTGVGASQPC